MQRREVVEVLFDSRTVKYEELVREAKKLRCASVVFTRSDEQMETAKKIVKNRAVRTDDKIRKAPQKDQKHSMGRHTLRFVPMTSMQACRVNAALAKKKKVDKLLSPGQQQLLKIIKAYPKAGWKNWIANSDFVKACSEIEKIVAKCAE